MSLAKKIADTFVSTIFSYSNLGVVHISVFPGNAHTLKVAVQIRHQIAKGLDRLIVDHDISNQDKDMLTIRPAVSADE